MTHLSRDPILGDIKIVYFFPTIRIGYVTNADDPSYMSYFEKPTEVILLESKSKNIPLIRWTFTTGHPPESEQETHWDIWSINVDDLVGVDGWVPIASNSLKILPEYKATVTLLGLEV